MIVGVAVFVAVGIIVSVFVGRIIVVGVKVKDGVEVVTSERGMIGVFVRVYIEESTRGVRLPSFVPLNNKEKP